MVLSMETLFPSSSKVNGMDVFIDIFYYICIESLTAMDLVNKALIEATQIPQSSPKVQELWGINWAIPEVYRGSIRSGPHSSMMCKV